MQSFLHKVGQIGATIVVKGNQSCSTSSKFDRIVCVSPEHITILYSPSVRSFLAKLHFLVMR